MQGRIKFLQAVMSFAKINTEGRLASSGKNKLQGSSQTFEGWWREV